MMRETLLSRRTKYTRRHSQPGDALMEPNKILCPDCDDPAFDRRGFLRSLSAVAAAAAAGGVSLWPTRRASAAPKPDSPAETAVKALYDTLTDKQNKAGRLD